MVSIANVGGREAQELTTGPITGAALALPDWLAQMVLADEDLGGIAAEIAGALDVGGLVASADGRGGAGARCGHRECAQAQPPSPRLMM